ncbi:MAG: hypothetical protein LUC45_09425 [Paraprevotella sp.]|nr:hypothetical protein [Paraprevotella sp.]
MEPVFNISCCLPLFLSPFKTFIAFIVHNDPVSSEKSVKGTTIMGRLDGDEIKIRSFAM